MRAQAMLTEATWRGCDLLMTLAHAGPMGSITVASYILKNPRKHLETMHWYVTITVQTLSKKPISSWVCCKKNVKRKPH